MDSNDTRASTIGRMVTKAAEAERAAACAFLRAWIEGADRHNGDIPAFYIEEGIDAIAAGAHMRDEAGAAEFRLTLLRED